MLGNQNRRQIHGRAESVVRWLGFVTGLRYPSMHSACMERQAVEMVMAVNTVLAGGRTQKTIDLGLAGQWTGITTDGNIGHRKAPHCSAVHLHRHGPTCHITT